MLFPQIIEVTIDDIKEQKPYHHYQNCNNQLFFLTRTGSLFTLSRASAITTAGMSFIEAEINNGTRMTSSKKTKNRNKVRNKVNRAK